LRPGGTLVNVQPAGGRIELSVSHAAGRESFGVAYNAPSFEDGLVLIGTELHRRVDARELVCLAEEQFEMEFRFETPEDWHGFVSRPHAGGLDVEPPRLQRIQSVLGAGHGAVIATDPQRAATFRHVPASRR